MFINVFSHADLSGGLVFIL